MHAVTGQALGALVSWRWQGRAPRTRCPPPCQRGRKQCLLQFSWKLAPTAAPMHAQGRQSRCRGSSDRWKPAAAARPGGPRARLAVRTHLLFTGCHTMNLLALATGALAATRAWEAPAMRRVAIATGLLLRVSWMKQGARVECG